MDERLGVFLVWLMANKGKIIGTGLGILLGSLTIKYGFIKAIFVLLCLLIGYVLGAHLDERGGTRAFLGSIFPSGRR